MGLEKNLTFYGLAAMATNIRKGAKFLTLYGIREPVPTVNKTPTIRWYA